MSELYLQVFKMMYSFCDLTATRLEIVFKHNKNNSTVNRRYKILHGVSHYKVNIRGTFFLALDDWLYE